MFLFRLREYRIFSSTSLARISCTQYYTKMEHESKKFLNVICGLMLARIISLPYVKSYSGFRFLIILHQPADGFQNNFDFFIMLPDYWLPRMVARYSVPLRRWGC